ncbi:hypothetical protein F8388_011665 [Cannabis sativa]|uniref:CCHC-type domain-containing protein n=1 Tax=Cannabis sativa TaxID=3483 RepID=A0A7J6GX57_CANSA|nr:hypothetical protein G4B88_030507 [Cannabis sativa]KAF4387517.1 hypothetical protein F8388_011665 [Cannabis sativa]
MALVNATYSSNHGKCFTCEEASVKLIPCESSQALHSFCLLGKVVAPMVVNEATIIDFVEKVWKFNVSVVAVNEGANNRNCFELGFTSAGNRIWALENGPWCVRGYSFLLKVWEPLKDLSAVFNSVKIWIHIFNLPRDYFSADNGNLLGKKAGQVLYVNADEGFSAPRSKALKVLIRLNVNQPLFAGCYIGLESGSQRWIQFKYEKMGIFCYNCGVMGHQRRGCTLSSPITVASISGVPFPMYGPWISMESTYLDVFSGAFTFNPSSTPVNRAKSTARLSNQAVKSISVTPGSQPLAVTTGSKGLGRKTSARMSNQAVKATARGGLVRGQMRRKVWVPKASSASRTPGFSLNGNQKRFGNQEGGKEVVPFPGFNLKFENREMNIGKGKGLRFGCSKVNVGPAFSCSGPVSKLGFLNDCASSNGPRKDLHGQIHLNGGGPLAVQKEIGKAFLEGGGPTGLTGHLEPSHALIEGNENIGPALSNSIESSICGQEVNFHHDEQLALTNFFQAQGTTLQELKKFGNLDLYEIKSIGGDIGVPTTSEVNERTTSFKKRKFDETTASLCSRPWKLLHPHPWAIRDFPWDSKDCANDTMESKEEPSEEASLSNNDFTGPDEWKTKGKNVISSRPMEGTFVIEDSGSPFKEHI